MRKSKAIRYLKNQIEKIEDKSIRRDEWLSSTVSVILKVFPVSSEIKIGQLREIQNSPGYFEDITSEEQILVRKNKAERYLQNYIEEIELLGTENSGNKLELFFGSLRFWLLLIALCSLSFLAGNSASKTLQQSNIREYEQMEQQIITQKKKIDSLNRELTRRRILG